MNAILNLAAAALTAASAHLAPPSAVEATAAIEPDPTTAPAEPSMPLVPQGQGRPLVQCVLPPQPEAPPNAWPNGIVYFEFDANVGASERLAAREAMDDWNQCGANVAFVPRTSSSQPAIHFIDSTGNSSNVGQIGGVQQVRIYNWSYEFIIAHELGHALGMWHEQARWDRDQYVSIVTGNIESGFASQFDKVSLLDWLTTSTPYDFDSVMHYGECAFTTCLFCVGGCETILCTPPYASYQSSIGQRDHLSTYDKQDIINVYGVGVTPTYVLPTLAVSSENGSLEAPCA